MNFEEIMRRAREGDAEAIEELVRVYYNDVRIVVSRRLSPALRVFLETEAVMNSIYLALRKQLRGSSFHLNDERHLIRQMIRIAQNRIACHWRKQRRIKRLNSEQTEGDPLEILLELTVRSNSPDSQVAVDELIRQVLDQLAPLEKKILQLRLDGYSNSEIAQELQLSSEGLRTRLHRLRRRLKEAKVFSNV